MPYNYIVDGLGQVNSIHEYHLRNVVGFIEIYVSEGCTNTPGSKVLIHTHTYIITVTS